MGEDRGGNVAHPVPPSIEDRGAVPHPSSRRRCTLGGRVGHNASMVSSNPKLVRHCALLHPHRLVATGLQVGRGCLFPLACIGRTTPHGVMYHPPQSPSNVVLDRRVVGRGQVRPADNYIGVATALVMGKRHHRARYPHPSWQRSPLQRVARAERHIAADRRIPNYGLHGVLRVSVYGI